MPWTTVVAGTPITAAWANANVRDQTVAIFANSAARASAIAAPGKGQPSYLQDVGAFELYAGPGVGWRANWSAPWGYLWSELTNKQALWVTDGNTAVQVFTRAQPVVAGRRYRVLSTLSVYAAAEGWVDHVLPGISTFRQGVQSKGSFEPEVFSVSILGVASSTTTVSFTINTGGPNNQGGVTVGGGGVGSRYSFWMIDDVGPSANPTALYTDDQGIDRVDVASLEPEFAGFWTPEAELWHPTYDAVVTP